MLVDGTFWVPTQRQPWGSWQLFLCFGLHHENLICKWQRAMQKGEEGLKCKWPAPTHTIPHPQTIPRSKSSQPRSCSPPSAQALAAGISSSTILECKLWVHPWTGSTMLIHSKGWRRSWFAQFGAISHLLQNPSSMTTDCYAWPIQERTQCTQSHGSVEPRSNRIRSNPNEQR